MRNKADVARLKLLRENSTDELSIFVHFKLANYFHFIAPFPSKQAIPPRWRSISRRRPPPHLLAGWSEAENGEEATF
jgi:hypothetical protein